MTTVLTPSLVQGTVYSSAVAWESNSQQAVDAIGLLSDADIADATKTLTLTLESSFDGGITFQTEASSPWVGGTLDRSGNPAKPQIQSSWMASSVQPTHIRVRLDCPEIISVGAAVVYP